MLAETSVSGSSTVSTFVPNIGFKADQSNTSYDTLILHSFHGDESLATSQDAALLQRKLAELRRDLYLKCTVENWIDALREIPIFPILVDASYFEPVEAQRTFFESREQEQFVARLATAFESEPLEDGRAHPAEQIIGKALHLGEDRRVLEWLRILSLDAEYPSFAASVLRCLGRQSSPGTASWRAGLVRSGLSMENVEMRDAAVQAIESWGERDLINVLRTHHEPEPWLREYIQDVIDDLGA